MVHNLWDCVDAGGVEDLLAPAVKDAMDAYRLHLIYMQIVQDVERGDVIHIKAYIQIGLLVHTYKCKNLNEGGNSARLFTNASISATTRTATSPRPFAGNTRHSPCSPQGSQHRVAVHENRKLGLAQLIYQPTKPFRAEFTRPHLEGAAARHPRRRLSLCHLGHTDPWQEAVWRCHRPNRVT